MKKESQSAHEGFHKQLFGTAALQVDLKGRSVRGGAVTAVGQACGFVLRILSTILLARLLHPGDFGLIGMVTAVTGFIFLFKDLGLSMATIQNECIDHRQVSTLFWINVVSGIVLAVLTICVSPAIAWFYGEPKLIRITMVISASFLLGGLAVQHQALLKRQMRFVALTAIEIAALFCGISFALVAAAGGLGYWSLVLQQVFYTFSYTAGVWLMCHWRPGHPSLQADVKSMLAFGGSLTVFSMFNYFARNMDNILIGRYCGPVLLGFYSKAYELLMVPINQLNTPISAVAIPALSRLQSQHGHFRSYYLRGIELLTAFGMPLVIFLAIAADRIIPIVLGPQWADSVAVYRFLAPAAFIGTFNVATGWVYISLGQASRQLRYGILESVVTVISFFIGVHWGINGVAVAFSISQPVTRLPGIIYCYNKSPLKTVDLLRTLQRPVIASLTAGIIVFLVYRWLGAQSTSSSVVLLSLGGLYCVLYLTAWMILPGGPAALRGFMTLYRELRMPLSGPTKKDQ